MKKEELFDKAEAYFKGQLSEAEKVAFEKELAKDDALAEEVKIYSRVIAANSEKDIIGLRATMKDILREEQHEQQIPAKKGNVKWGLLIAIVLFLAAFIYFMVSRNSLVEPQEKTEETTNDRALLPSKSLEQTTTPATEKREPSTPVKEPDAENDKDQPANSGETENKETSQAIAMAYYEIPESILPGNSRINRDTPLKSLSISEQARIAFQKGLDLKASNKEQSEVFFQESITLLDSLIRKNQNLRAVYYRAHAKFQLTEYSEASKGFEAALKSRQFQEEAAWNLILTNLINGTEYQEMLKSITDNPGHKFYDKAIALDKALGN